MIKRAIAFWNKVEEDHVSREGPEPVQKLTRFLSGYVVECVSFPNEFHMRQERRDIPSYPNTFTPPDNLNVTGFTKLTLAKTKPDGSKDKAKLTLENGLISATKPAGIDESVSLSFYAPNTTTPKVYKLDESDKFKWTREAGVLSVEYLFKDSTIDAKSNGTASVCVTPTDCIHHQLIDYAEGAESVASVESELDA
ncbi:hypothetical protein BLNAU_6060 [Blattamonas nauphoetae]|uniref:Uncharacterized protein n=1 Tax=Blattamonas nauphoetae TaxID=2049346 RepID=A0ABQ9Y5R5_9EUKA|nr:hypothetical protein BLNAU_6060 [Blattamonas nauphoetae]